MNKFFRRKILWFIGVSVEISLVACSSISTPVPTMVSTITATTQITATSLPTQTAILVSTVTETVTSVPEATATVTPASTQEVTPTTAEVTATVAPKTEFTPEEIAAAMVPDANGKLYISSEMFRFLAKNTMDSEFWKNIPEVAKEPMPTVSADVLKAHGIPDNVARQILAQTGQMRMTYLSPDFQWKDGMTIQDIIDYSFHDVHFDVYGNRSFVWNLSRPGIIINQRVSNDTYIHPWSVQGEYVGYQDLDFDQRFLWIKVTDKAGKADYLPLSTMHSAGKMPFPLAVFLIDKQPVKVFYFDFSGKNQENKYWNVLKPDRMVCVEIHPSLSALIGSDYAGMFVLRVDMLGMQTTSQSQLLNGVTEWFFN